LSFVVASVDAHDIDIKLPGENVGLPGDWFRFKVGRAVFWVNKDWRGMVE
jgi:hypothetical protein